MGVGITPAWPGVGTTTFDIPAGEFVKTILLWSEQAHVWVSYDVAHRGDTFKGIRTNAVTGKLGPHQALNLLLAGTSLVPEWDGEDSVIIWKGGASASPDASVTGVKGRGPDHQQSGISAGSSGQSQPKFEEVTVTGTLIHGALDSLAPLTVVNGAELQQAPYATVQDSLQSLPFIAKAPQSEDFGGTGNFNRGTALNLRGLGPEGTLVLVNGRRQPSAGYQGDFIDVSNVPVSAIERIEVLPDGASALYGSDAIAGVVNIIMRDDLRGGETQIRTGNGPGGGNERLVAQLYGGHSQTSHWLAAYQFSERTDLSASERAYSANLDKRPEGGTDFRSSYSNPANILDPLTLQPVYAIPAGQDGRTLLPSQLLRGATNLENYLARYSLLPDKRQHSLYFTGTRQVSDLFELFADAHYSQRKNEASSLPSQLVLTVPRTNPFFVDPFGHSKDVLVSYSFMRDLGTASGEGVTRNYSAVTGLRTTLESAWHLSFTASRGEEQLRWIGSNLANPYALPAVLADPNPATAFDPFGDGSYTNPRTLAEIRTKEHVEAFSTIKAIAVSGDGPLVHVGVGALKLAVGAERRWESFDHALEADSIFSHRQQYARRVDSLYSELAIPLLGRREASVEGSRVSLSLAGRYEHYNDSGAAFSPRVSLSWFPLEFLRLHTTWGRSFRAPLLTDLYDTTTSGVVVAPLPDPRAPTGQSLAIEIDGNNRALRNETATTWLTGFDVTPGWVPGLDFSLSYYSIDYTNRISVPSAAIPTDILLQESQWAPAITRNPSPSLIHSLCTSPDFRGSVSGCLSDPPTVVVDYRPQNLASTRVRGFDLKLAQMIDTHIGKFHTALDGSYMPKFLQQATRTSPTLNVVDTVANPQSRRFRLTADWYQRGPLLPGLSVNSILKYTGGYSDTQSQPNRRVRIFATLDVQVNYRTASAESWWSNMTASLRTTNVFNSDPPFVNTEFGYDVASAQPYARMIGVFLQKSWD